MSDLTEAEQDHVREAIRYLYRRFGNWHTIAKAMKVKQNTLAKVMRRDDAVSVR